MIFSARAFLLHRWPYRESSLLLELLTEGHGRVRLIAKGARRGRSSLSGALQPFVPLQVSWSGLRDLKTLQQAEPASLALPLTGTAIYSGLYLNELLYRLLVPGVSYDSLFASYLACLCQLAANDGSAEAGLRCFELSLLESLGYGADFQRCAATGELITEQNHYHYHIDQGFVPWQEIRGQTFSGSEILAIASRSFQTYEARRAAKRFVRLALQPHLGQRLLRSRELFLSHSGVPRQSLEARVVDPPLEVVRGAP